MDTLEDSDFAKSGIRQTVYAVAFYVFVATRRYRFGRCLHLCGNDGWSYIGVCVRLIAQAFRSPGCRRV